jgi:predicted outer membrane repeat protein
MTLQTYISNNNYYVNSSTQLFISEGSHSLNTGFSVSNVVEFSMLSANDTQTQPVIICSLSSHFNLSNVTHANIEGLTFIGCGGNTAVSVEQFTIRCSSFVGDMNATTSLVIIESNMSLSESNFTSYQMGSYRNDRSLNLPLEHQHNSDVTVTVAVGGALVITNTTLSIYECHFEKNMANIGGAIFSEMGSNITISNSIFSLNHANLGQSELCYGGALFTDGTGIMTVMDSTFENNTSDRDGGVAAVFNSIMSISNTSVCCNTATMCGGALTIDVGSTLNLEETIFSHNVADDSGGALCVKGNSSIYSNSGVFVNNSALMRYGGSMYLHGSSATVDSSMFEYSKASSGGVAYAKSNASVTMNNCNVTDNRAKHHGGVVFLTECSKYFVTNCNFWYNAAEHGGVTYAREPGNMINISKSDFSFNTAALNGGVLVLIYGSSVFINDSTFDNNVANREGGVLYGLSMESSEVYQSVFKANKANIGGVFTIRDGSKFFTQYSIFSGNVESDLGAVLYVDNETDNVIYDSKFNDNSGNFGGVVHATRNSSVTVDNCTFDGNIARIDGGTLYGRANSTITITSSWFNNNTAINDAVMLAFDGSAIIMENITFCDNRAGHDGGAVYVYDNSYLEIINCSFTGNQANNSGGSVYGRKNSVITVTGKESNFVNCSAKNSGGGVYIQEDSELHLQSSEFRNNSAYSGGALHVYIRSVINMTDCTFSKNRAIQRGGVMNAFQLSNINAEACNFTFNRGQFGGISFIFQSSLTLRNCNVSNNTADFDGIFRVREQSTLHVSHSIFNFNNAENGGVMFVQDSNATAETASFSFNSARQKGGVVHAVDHSIILVISSNFSNNSVENDGGVITLLENTTADVQNSMFVGSRASANGAVIGIQQSSTLGVTNSTFSDSRAGSSGGVVRAINSSVSFCNSNFTQNSATKNGGIVYAHSMSSIKFLSSHFLRNTAKNFGGIVHLEGQSSAIIDDSTFNVNNAADKGGIVSATTQSDICITNSTFSNNSAKNGGVILAEDNSTIQFVTFSNEKSHDSESENLIVIENNVAMYGGGIYLSNSNLFIGTNSNFISNQANMSGGAVHADLRSSIVINSTVYFKSNRALSGYGGGINAQNTSITFGSTVDFIGNNASFGGGISLANSNLNDIAKDGLTIAVDVNFISNHADEGGALYVNDMEECSANTTVTACFVQSIAKQLRLNFNKNSANSTLKGNDLFGGLLDRCTIVTDPNSTLLEQNGATLFKNLSNITNFDTVYSEPTRVCPCQNNVPDCSLSLPLIVVKQGNGFMVGPIAAVDQVGHPLAGAVTSTVTLESRLISLSANQSNQEVGPNCTNLTYQIGFPRASRKYELILYANGPCGGGGISELSVNVQVLECSCPRGFTRRHLDPQCTCICDTDKVLSKYITVCNASSESVIRNGKFWITYLNENDSDPYFVYPYCPFDYCLPSSRSVLINLSLPNASDAQCIDNRGGILCGRCLADYSLSLGSSKCITCPSYWYGLLVGIMIAAILAGLVLVVLLLVFNLTVAIGTLNSIIFYANIIYVNRSIYFQQLPLTFVPVFISWLNLDIGFDTCFYNGMDEYVKTWLQLAFPLYIIFLVIVIIWISSCSSKFSYLLGKRNPVATLATLILLSYTKILETIVESLSFVSLNYPNGTLTFKWLPDANIEYGKDKHIALIIAALLILTLGLLYTFLITSWQWLLHCSGLKLFKWTRNQKLQAFIDTYHIPHTAKHRYWTGLLLLIRVVIFLIATFSVSIDPQITLLTTAMIMSCLLAYKTILMIRVYKNWLLNAMESYVCFNVTIFALITWYTFVNSGSKYLEILQTVVAYLSAGSVLIMLVLVIAFHIYRYGSAKVYLIGQSSKLGIKIMTQLSQDQGDGHHPPPDNALFDVMDRPRRDSRYVPPPNSQQPHTLPTSSEVTITDSQTHECPDSNDINSESILDEIQHWQAIPNDINNSRGNKRSKSLETPLFRNRRSEAKGSKPLILSYRAQGSRLIQPLLEEEIL